MKPLVSASYAQFGVDAEDEKPGQHVMAYVIPTHDSWRPILVVMLRNRVKPVLWRKLCAA